MDDPLGLMRSQLFSLTSGTSAWMPRTVGVTVASLLIISYYLPQGLANCKSSLLLVFVNKALLEYSYAH